MPDSNTVKSQLAWFDRRGSHLGDVGPAGAIASFALSPDDRRVAIAQFENGTGDIWLLDLGRSGVPNRFTFDPAPDSNPVWSPDSGRIRFYARRRGGGILFEKAVSETECSPTGPSGLGQCGD